MSKPPTTSTPDERPHSQGSKAVDCVKPMAHHTPDDAEIIQALADAVATGERDMILESAKRLVGYEEGSNITVPQLVSVEEIATKLNLCTRSIWRLVSKGELPQPILVGAARRWYDSDIRAFLAKQTAKRDGNQHHHRN